MSHISGWPHKGAECESGVDIAEHCTATDHPVEPRTMT